MTIVAVWFEPTENALWAVADTRISKPGSSGGMTIMTDSGAKLLALPIRCHRFTGDLSGQRAPHYLSSIGYAFAGDILPATMTFATATTFLQSLTTSGSGNPPPLSAIADMIRRVAERFSREALGSSNGQYGRFTVAIFGWCPIINRFAIYEITPQLESADFRMQCNEHLPEDNAFVVSFGSGAERLNDMIAFIRQHGDKHHRTARIPKLAAEAIIDEDIGDVGGSLSLGVAVPGDFRLYSVLRPIEPGKPEAKLSYNGIELNEDSMWVGQYMIAIDGVA
jgi:hypothetical protein